MSKKLIIAAALVMMAASCNKNQSYTPAFESGGEKGTASLTVNVSGLTKAASTVLTHLDNERALESNFQIVAYDVTSDMYGNDQVGAISTWYNVENVGSQSSFTTTLIPGKKRMYFVCNQALMSPSAASTWRNRSDIKTNTRDAFTETHLPLGLGFTSNYDLTVTAGESINRNIELVHMCSRIALKSIINETNDTRIQEMKGKSISLLNVPYGMSMDGTVDNADARLYNPAGGDYSTASKCAATTEKGAGPRSFCELAYTGTDLNPGYLYTYPGTKVRMLVGLDIKISNQTKTYYYSIPVTGLQFNKTYDVVLRVRNLGSLDPANPAIPTPATFSVSVADWTAADVIDEMM